MKTNLFCLSDDELLTILLVGKSDSGMSTIAKKIVKYKNFNSETCHNERLACKISKGYINSRSTTLVDTPGLFGADDETNEAEKIINFYANTIANEIILLFVIRAAPISKFDEKVFDFIRNLITRKGIVHTIVILTRKESDTDFVNAVEFIKDSGQLYSFTSDNRCKHCLYTFSRKKELENIKSLFSEIETLIGNPNDESESNMYDRDVSFSNDQIDRGKAKQMNKTAHEEEMAAYDTDLEDDIFGYGYVETSKFT